MDGTIADESMGLYYGDNSYLWGNAEMSSACFCIDILCEDCSGTFTFRMRSSFASLILCQVPHKFESKFMYQNPFVYDKAMLFITSILLGEPGVSGDLYNRF